MEKIVLLKTENYSTTLIKIMIRAVVVSEENVCSKSQYASSGVPGNPSTRGYPTIFQLPGSLVVDQGTRYPEYRNRTGIFLPYRNRIGTGLPKTGTGPEPALGPEGNRNSKCCLYR